MGVKINLIGKKFGRLIVLCDSKQRSGSSVMWKCLCDCGNTTTVRAPDLKRGITQSCGCLHRELLAKRRYKHGESNRNLTRLYNLWLNMKRRCDNPDHTKYKYYGGKGISVCDEWRGNYSAFKSWAILNGYQDNLSIDRINNNGNYEPNNCQWITMSENSIKSHRERACV